MVYTLQIGYVLARGIKEKIHVFVVILCFCPGILASNTVAGGRGCPVSRCCGRQIVCRINILGYVRVTRGHKINQNQFCDLSVYFGLTNLKSKTAQDNLPGQMNHFSTVSRRLIRNLFFTLGIFVLAPRYRYCTFIKITQNLNKRGKIFTCC